MADVFPDELARDWILDALAIDTLKTLAIDAVEKANSGHPGMPLGAAPMAHVLWTRHLKFDPADPAWPDRDRFVLSAGHGSMLLYSLLHLAGYGLGIEELEAFRQWGSRTPGHPEHGHHPRGGDHHRTAGGRLLQRRWAWPSPRRSWRPPSTGPAIRWSTTTPTRIVGDGDLMEGVSLGGRLPGRPSRPGQARSISTTTTRSPSRAAPTWLSPRTWACASRPTAGRCVTVADGNDLAAIDEAITAARAETTKPSLIKVRTVIGCGSPNKAGTADCHGSPLGAEEVEADQGGAGLARRSVLRRARAGARPVRRARCARAERCGRDGSRLIGGL